MRNRFLAFLASALLLLLSSSALTAALLTRELRLARAKEAPPTATVIAVGDIMLSRMVMRRLASPPTQNYPFTHVQHVLQTADIAFGNLETPVTEGEPISTTTMKFRAEPGVEKNLFINNLRFISLANNHMFDQGHLGMLRTIDLLRTKGIVTSGADVNEATAYDPQYIETNGIRIALLAYVDPAFAPASYRANDIKPGLAVMDVERVRIAIAEANQHADIVLVSIHSGMEYTDIITNTQRDFSRSAIDAGADIVLGHHPHVIQERELWNGKPIYYSLGNFVFDQLWSDETRRGLMLRMTMTKDGITNIEHIPVYIDKNYQPAVAEGIQKEEMLQRLKLQQ